MESDRSASANGHPVSPPDDSGSSTEIARLQAQCRQQAVAIDTLSEAVATLRRGATALKAENAELRAELGGPRLTRRSSAGAAGRLAHGELVELVVALDARAPGAARAFVIECLEQRVVASVREIAQRVVSELVTNSLRHGGARTGDVVVSVELMPELVRVGVHDSGSDGVIAAQPPDLDTGGVGSGSISCRCSASAGASSGSPRGARRSGAAPRSPREGETHGIAVRMAASRDRRSQAPAPSRARRSDRAPSRVAPQGVDAPGGKSAIGRRRDGL